MTSSVDCNCKFSELTFSPGVGGGGNSHMEQTGMLVGNFEFNPKGDHLGVAQAFFDP